MTRVILHACLLAFVFLIALWAFVSYLQPAFSGERVSEILRCD